MHAPHQGELLSLRDNQFVTAVARIEEGRDCRERLACVQCRAMWVVADLDDCRGMVVKSRPDSC